jgi:hypothetical protein
MKKELKNIDYFLYLEGSEDNHPHNLEVAAGDEDFESMSHCSLRPCF